MNLKRAAFKRLCTGFLLSLISFSALAAQPAMQQAPAPIAPAISFGSMLQILLGLGLVLAAVVGSAWLLRRFSPGQIGAGGAIKVIAGVALGPKERLVLVEIGETWLVLGVAPGQVNSLHTLPKPEGGAFAVEPVSGEGQGFAVWLKQAMQGHRVER